MKARLLQFFEALRASGLHPTIAETLDAMQAVSVTGVERAALREALAAALVKDEADRPGFDTVFERFFALPPRRPGQRTARRTGFGSAGGAATAHGKSPHGKPHPREDDPASDRNKSMRLGRDRVPHKSASRRLARQRELAQIPFDAMAPDQIEECDLLVEKLARRFRAHLARRHRHASRGRLDIRRTIRQSLSTGGVPLRPAFRHRPPGRPDLVALCDHSHSVATASHFLLGLLQPAGSFFRKARLFAYVDSAVEVSIEDGRFTPHAPLDLYARSDFGRALATFYEQHEGLLTRNTVLLILGDARNNRRPPRADVLRQARQRARRTIWVNPEAPARWNTGDSVMQAYVPHCDAVLAATNLQQLLGTLRQAFSAMR